MHGKIFTEEITYVLDKKELRLEGPNNKKAKFPKVICEQCNNSETYSHDQAFDKLIIWSNKNFDKMSLTRTLDFEEIYGDNWQESKINLLKYLAKHAGCKIATAQIDNDVSKLSDLIYRNKSTNTFQIKFLVKEAFYYLDLVLQHRDERKLKFISNSSTIFRNRGNNKTAYFGGMTTYNWLSIAWVHSQNNFITRFDGFTKQKEDIQFLPFEDLPEIGTNKQWIEFIDSQGIETLEDQMNFYDPFIENLNQ